jgi:excisionase family DNA binding protein
MSSQPSARADGKSRQGGSETTLISSTQKSTEQFENCASPVAIRRLEIVADQGKESPGHRDRPANDSQGSENLLTVSQVARRLGMSTQWVRDHIDRRQPRIDVVRWGSAVRFRPSDVDRFIIQHVNAPRLRRRRA